MRQTNVLCESDNDADDKILKLRTLEVFFL